MEFSGFHFALGLIATWIYLGCLALVGWRLQEPIASDRGKWRIFWERAFFRDMMMFLRWGGCAGLIALGVVTMIPITAAAFSVGVLLAAFTRVIGELPAIFLARYGIKPQPRKTRSSGETSSPTSKSGNGRDP